MQNAMQQGLPVLPACSLTLPHSHATAERDGDERPCHRVGAAPH